MKHSIFPIIALLIFVSISCSQDNKTAPVASQEIPILDQTNYIYVENDLGYYKAGYFYKVDLNNDGSEEVVEVIEPYRFFTNIPDSVWGDDTGAVIRILDSNGEVAYLKDLPRYQPVGDVSIADIDQDGFEEIIVSMEEAEGFEAKTYIYGWRNDGIRGRFQVVGVNLSQEP